MNESEVQSARAPSLCAVYRLLADARRRAVLAVLDARETPIHVENLARAVAAREEGAAPATVTSERVRDAVASLHHVHLPKLDDHDVVEYDPETGVVDTATGFADVAGAVDGGTS